MNCFKDNNCRLCKKVFCCKKCREKHEVTAHKIFIKCDICIYGKTFLADPSEELIRHIKNRHWPLHCVLCKRFFRSLEDFMGLNNCPGELQNKEFEKNSYTPIQNENGDRYESPHYFPNEHLTVCNTYMFSNLATSTPLQQDNSLSKKDQELITPVDLSNINKGKKYLNECVSLQRKVTFYETPVVNKENIQKTDELEDRIIVTPSSENNSAMFYSAKCLQSYAIPIIITPVDDNTNNTNEKKPKVENGDTTLWISAMNTPSPTTSTEYNKQLVSATPFITKFKKRQVSVVLPTTIRKSDDELDVSHSTDLNTCERNEAIVLNVLPRSDVLGGTNVESKISSVKTSDTSKALLETSVNAPKRLWTSVSRLVKNVSNVVQEFSNVTYTFKTPLKRCILEDNSTDGPSVKRYKLTEIKCRRPIRDFCTSKCSIEYGENVKYSSSNITAEIKKTFADKATQTD